MNAVFNLQLECHRHTQAHKSKKDGSTKWAMIEMWPMLVTDLHISFQGHICSACTVCYTNIDTEASFIVSANAA